MGAIEYKRTELADPETEWDGPAEVAAASVEDLRIMCAWYDGDRPDVKESYKLPHHKAQGHACVLKGVQSALHLLNATHMPEDDRPAVEAHLRHHLRDFGHDTDSTDDTDSREQEGRAMNCATTSVALSIEGGSPMKGDATIGRVYEVLAITPGDGNGLHYGEAVLRAAVPLFEGVTVHVDHAQLGELLSFTGGRSVRTVLGVLEGCAWGNGGVAGRLRVYPGPDAGWVTAMVDAYLADRAAGRATPKVGLSAVLDVKVDGKEVQSIEEVVSVDVVYDPARGGEFIRAMNCATTSARQQQQKEAVTVEEDKQEKEGSAGGAAVVAAPSDQDAQGIRDSLPMTPEFAVELGNQALDMRLRACGLPDALKDVVRQEFGGRFWRSADVDARIEALQSAWAASIAAAGPAVRGVGEGRLTVGLNEVDRLQAVMDKLCGLKPASEALQGVRPVSGIRELYLMLTGDYDFRGVFDAERVGLANISTSTMTSLVKNAYNKVLLDYFNTADRWWEPIITEEDFQTLKDVTLITVGGFSDLSSVTEGDAYTELEWSDTEEVVSFVKKGNYVGVTLEMMDRDDTATFRAIPKKLAIAGYRTLSAAIANLWLANSGVGGYWPASQSTYRLFCSNYGNLGTSALSASAWDAVIQAMYKQAEATSGERMGIRPAYLVVPIELEKTALTIMQSEGEPGTADNDANVRRGSSRVVVCPEMTDANDWLAVADPRVWPAIVVGYRFGRVPEVFVADQDLVGSMFTNDEMRIKVRFFFAAGVCDYRPLYKCNVS